MAGKRVKGPKDAPIKETKFHGKEKTNVSDPANAKSLVLLSIAGNEYCTKEYLEASAKQSSTEFGFTTFLIADEVYWHNLKDAEHLPSEQINALKNNALSLGDIYFQNNITAFLKLFDKEVQGKLLTLMEGKSVNEKIDIINQEAAIQGKNFEIVRWNTWTTQRTEDKAFDYQEEKDHIAELYTQPGSLNTSIMDTALDFADRHKQHGGKELWMMRSKGYLTEESPAVIYLGALRNYNFIIYPGDKISTFQETQNYFVVQKEVNSSATSETASDPLNPNTQLNSGTQQYVIRAEQPRSLLNWIQPFFTRGHSSKIAETMEAAQPTSESPSQTTTTTVDSIDDLTKTLLSFIKKEANLENRTQQAASHTFFGEKQRTSLTNSSTTGKKTPAQYENSMDPLESLPSEMPKNPSEDFYAMVRTLVPVIVKLSPDERRDVVHVMEYFVAALDNHDRQRNKQNEDPAELVPQNCKN